MLTFPSRHCKKKPIGTELVGRDLVEAEVVLLGSLKGDLAVGRLDHSVVDRHPHVVGLATTGLEKGHPGYRREPGLAAGGACGNLLGLDIPGPFQLLVHGRQLGVGLGESGFAPADLAGETAQFGAVFGPRWAAMPPFLPRTRGPELPPRIALIIYRDGTSVSIGSMGFFLELRGSAVTSETCV